MQVVAEKVRNQVYVDDASDVATSVTSGSGHQNEEFDSLKLSEFDLKRESGSYSRSVSEKRLEDNPDCEWFMSGLRS